MMYQNKFVACVVVGDKPQKELPNGVIELPFSTDYSLRFRNKHSQRALVRFSIDGEDVSGNGYIIPANGVIEIDRFHDVAKKFNFVPLDSDEAIDYGKNGLQDGTKGLIVATFWLEKETPPWDSIRRTLIKKKSPYNPPVEPWIPTIPSEPWIPTIPSEPWKLPRDPLGRDTWSCINSVDPIAGANTSFSANANNALNNLSMSIKSFAEPTDGVTVEGSRSNQEFTTSYFDTDESNSTVIKIFLKGKRKNQENKDTQRQRQIEKLNQELNRLKNQIAELNR